MLTEIKMTFYNLGLRSWIECDLCYRCPLNQSKGCCSYNPTYHLVDLGYIGSVRPDILPVIMGKPRLVIEEFWLSVSYLEDSRVGRRCQFNTDTGCQLPVEYRESVCRHFICPGIRLWEEESLARWAEFFQEIEATEAEFNQRLRLRLQEAGVDLRSSFPTALDILVREYRQVLAGIEAERFGKYPSREQIVLSREIVPGEKWIV